MTKGFYPAIQRNAQQLYNWREQTQEISGTELAQLFQELTGAPSPAGRTPIDIARMERIAAENTGARMGDWANAALVALQTSWY